MSENKFLDIAYKDLCSEKTLQSNSQGFFLNFADFVVEEVGKAWIKENFNKLRSDNERIKFVYECEKVKDYVLNFLSNVKEVYREKNASFSQKKRLEADHLLKQKDPRKALMLYCQSVLRAPRTGADVQIDSGLSLSLALWGRSQALIELRKYREALSDIQQALKENLSGSYKAQAFWKMGICYRAMNDENKAKVSYDLAEKLLGNDKEKIRQLNEDRMRSFPKEEVTVDSQKPKLSTEFKHNLPNASGKLSVKISKEAGRYIIANEDIQSGETLVVESPYVACLLPEMFGLQCHHCFKNLESPMGCLDCSSVAFCTSKCRDEAVSTYHKHECKYLDLLIGSGMSILAHSALRMVTQNGLKKSLDIYHNRKNEKIYALCTHVQQRPPLDFFQRSLMAAFLLRCLQMSGFFPNTSRDQVVPTEEGYQIGEMLLFNLQMLQFNAHEVYVTKYTSSQKVVDSKIVYIGVALYLTTSIFNHDCHPAMTRHFVGKDIVLVAARPIKANEPVPENYGMIFTRKVLSDRQRTLSSRYWFQCRCLACTQNWPAIGMGLEQVSKRLKCPTSQCSQTFTLPVAKESLQCPKCKKIVNLTNKILLLHWCEEQYQQAFQFMDDHEMRKAIDILTSTIDTFYKIALPPHQQTHLAEEMLRLCLVHLGNASFSLENQPKEK
ncbi:SET and MYND domain-containing protein 4-like [Sitophilus oryzae]|uniref:Protein-lysine N-methyltransferase SMYD4 n=1 Tax=Sitophilus oryzae TaxID=7048 RepID=A0A6J2XLM5_SITOR|nr:SET and MYND domain-containing protein 4-like [Sitophilus oryzae]